MSLRLLQVVGLAAALATTSNAYAQQPTHTTQAHNDSSLTDLKPFPDTFTTSYKPSKTSKSAKVSLDRTGLKPFSDAFPTGYKPSKSKKIISLDKTDLKPFPAGSSTGYKPSKTRKSTKVSLDRTGLKPFPVNFTIDSKLQAEKLIEVKKRILSSLSPDGWFVRLIGTMSKVVHACKK